MKITRGTFLLLAVSVAAAIPSDGTATAADHRDGPIFATLGPEAQADINDVYAFASPETAGNTVLILTVSPLAGLFGPKTFAFGVNHDFRLDLDGDAREDATFNVTFKRPSKTGEQRLKVKFKGSGDSFVEDGVVGADVTLPGGGKLRAGIFDDPFFFDLLAFRNQLQFSQQNPFNFFRGLNTLAIVLEVPNSTFGNSTKVGVWCTTGRGRKQIDRMGRPAINTVLVQSGKKDAFNRSHPSSDLATFGPDAKAIITQLSDANNADTLVPILFPDILTFAPGDTNGFDNLNGRKLDDDVIDAELTLLSAGGVTTDFVDNDSTFGTTFPYLAPPNP